MSSGEHTKVYHTLQGSDDNDDYETPLAAVQVSAMDVYADRAMEVKYGYYPDEAVPEVCS